MRIVQLKTSEPAGNFDPAKRHRFADGKRITKERYDGITQIADLDTFHTSHRKGRCLHFVSARIPNWALRSDGSVWTP